MRLFVAVDLSDKTRVELGRVRGLIEPALAQARVRPRVTWVKAEAAHVTLRFIGEVSEDISALLSGALGEGFEVPPFNICWETIGTFPGGRFPRAIWVGATSGAEQLDSLARLVNERLEPTIGPGESRPFAAHLTLARINGRGSGVDWPQVLASAGPRPTKTCVDHVTLYRSQLSSMGPTYTALCQASLSAKVTS